MKSAEISRSGDSFRDSIHFIAHENHLHSGSLLTVIVVCYLRLDSECSYHQGLYAEEAC